MVQTIVFLSSLYYYLDARQPPEAASETLADMAAEHCEDLFSKHRRLHALMIELQGHYCQTLVCVQCAVLCFRAALRGRRR